MGFYFLETVSLKKQTEKVFVSESRLKTDRNLDKKYKVAIKKLFRRLPNLLYPITAEVLN